MYLVKNGSDGNDISNTILLTNAATDETFYTTTNSPSVDEINNIMSYNYGAGGFDLGNPVAYVIDSHPDVDPVFVEQPALDWTSSSVSSIMSNNFIIDKTSPAVDAGDNAFVSDIDTDIINNPRIYISGLVDIGPYELQVHQLSFTADDIQSIFQDKLNIDYSNKQYIPVNSDDIYKDLYNQFDSEPSYRTEFARESKIVIKLKSVYKEIIYYSDKESPQLVEYDAYYDSGTMSIIIEKTDETLGNALSEFFNDGRYVFYFNEVTHKLTIYINQTYNKGKSGKGNIINNIRIGGTTVLGE